MGDVNRGIGAREVNRGIGGREVNRGWDAGENRWMG